MNGLITLVVCAMLCGTALWLHYTPRPSRKPSKPTGPEYDIGDKVWFVLYPNIGCCEKAEIRDVTSTAYVVSTHASYTRLVTFAEGVTLLAPRTEKVAV